MRARYSFVVLAILAIAMGTIAYVAAVHYYNAGQASQRAQGAALEHKLCTTLKRLAALKPPPAAPSDLSRAYLLQQHEVLAQLGPDVGC